jgi:hypothetical protein
MPNFLNDGNIPFGSQIVTINVVGGTSLSLVAEQIDFEEKSTSILRRNEINIPNGGVYIQDLVTGTMTLQLPDLTTQPPPGQSLVTMLFRGAEKTFVITDLKQPQKQNQIRKLDMKITEILNPTNVVLG